MKHASSFVDPKSPYGDVATQTATAAKTKALSETQSEQVITSVEKLTRDLFDANVRLDLLERIQKEHAQLEALINRALKESSRTTPQ